MKAIGKKLDRYKNPWLELKIQYGQNKGKLYNEECDRFMVKFYFLNFLLREVCIHIIPPNFVETLDRSAWFTNSDMEIGMS